MLPIVIVGKNCAFDPFTRLDFRSQEICLFVKSKFEAAQRSEFNVSGSTSNPRRPSVFRFYSSLWLTCIYFRLKDGHSIILIAN